MCKVKTGKLILNSQDVQNMVVGIIFRQKKKYKLDTIVDLASFYLKGSPVKMKRKELSRIVEDNLNLLAVNGRINYQNGHYYPTPLVSYF